MKAIEEAAQAQTVRAGQLHPYQYRLLKELSAAVLNGKKPVLYMPRHAGRTAMRQLLKQRFPYLYGN